MGLTIKEVSEKFGIPSETLRYYERVGVIPPVTRTASGIRNYQEEDLAWVENAKCFRAAGVSIEALIEYLNEQRAILLAQQKQLVETLDRLDYKISKYESAVKTGKLTWD